MANGGHPGRTGSRLRLLRAQDLDALADDPIVPGARGASLEVADHPGPGLGLQAAVAVVRIAVQEAPTRRRHGLSPFAARLPEH